MPQKYEIRRKRNSFVQNKKSKPLLAVNMGLPVAAFRYIPAPAEAKGTGAAGLPPVVGISSLPSFYAWQFA